VYKETEQVQMVSVNENRVQRRRTNTKWFLATRTVCKEVEQIQNGFRQQELSAKK
jgi:hypothetical protein